MSVFGVILVRIFRIWTEYEEILRISLFQAKYEKMRTRITPNTDIFYAVINVNIKCKTLINDCINSSDFLAYKVNFYVQHLALAHIYKNVGIVIARSYYFVKTIIVASDTGGLRGE